MVGHSPIWGSNCWVGIFNAKAEFYVVYLVGGVLGCLARNSLASGQIEAVSSMVVVADGHRILYCVLCLLFGVYPRGKPPVSEGTEIARFW